MKTNSIFSRNLLASRRNKLIISIIASALVFLISRNTTSGIISFMLTWIAFAFSNLFCSWVIILSYHPMEVRGIAKEEDSSGIFIFFLVLMAAFISLFAIIFLLRSLPDESRKGLNIHILLSIASIFCSWTLIHTLFSFRYAHKYYDNFDRSNNDCEFGEGLDFPNEKNPDFLDFVYFSFIIGMTFQVSDVEITSRDIRRLALLHSVLSFIYNTVIVALSINIISGVISK
jgi:uncharacterized membrane protein